MTKDRDRKQEKEKRKQNRIAMGDNKVKKNGRKRITE